MSTAGGSSTKIITAVVLVIIVIVAIYASMTWITNSAAEEDNNGICKIESPREPTAVSSGNNKILFSWESVIGANNYLIFLGDENVSTEVYEHKIETSTNPFLYELSEDVTSSMFFIIVAKRDICTTDTCVGCVSEPTDIIPVTVNCDLPEMPTLFDDTTVIDDTIYVSWYPLDNAHHYTLYFKEQEPGPNELTPPSPQNFDSKVSIDHPNWWYVFQIPQSSTYPWSVGVTATNECGEGLVSFPYQAPVF